MPDRGEKINLRRRTCAAEPADLTSRPGEPDHLERTTAVQAAHRAGVAVPLGDAARQLGVRPGVLMRPGVARVRVQAAWYTSPAEVERLRRILRTLCESPAAGEPGC